MATTTASGPEVHMGMVGVAFRLTVTDEDGPVDVSQSDAVLVIIFNKPNGTVWEVEAEAVEGETGVIQYVTESASDLDCKGNWQYQAYIEISGFKGHTSISVEYVHGNLKRAA